MAIHATHLCAARSCPHRRPGRDQVALLPQHEADQSDADRAERPAHRLSAALGLALAAALTAPSAMASSDPLSGIAAPGGAGTGAAVRLDRSPYRSAGPRHAFLPPHLHEADDCRL